MTAIDESYRDIFVSLLFTGFVIIQTNQRSDLDVAGAYTVTVSSAGSS